MSKETKEVIEDRNNCDCVANCCAPKDEVKENVKKFYTEAIADDTSCGCGPTCCSSEQEVSFSESYKDIEGYEDEADYGLGCGIPTEFAQINAGDTVLDLGSGAGNDVFVARRIVGESGHVIGVDMTTAMINKANENKAKLGYENVSFLLGDIEALPIEDEQIDVVVSNCVMNLVQDKKLAYSEVHRVLRPNGHFSISDIVLNGTLPEGIKNAAVMYAGCVSGALSKTDYLIAIKDAGFDTVEIVKEREINLPDDLLLKYISKAELAEYKASKSAVISVTVYAKK